MAKKKKTNSCLIGCGVGCLILLILGIAMFAGGAVWMRGLVSGFEDAAETRDALEAEFGEPGDFTPAADGSIATERLEIFLAVREATQESRAGVRSSFEALPLSEAEAQQIEDQAFFEKMGSVFGITSSALGLAGRIGDFFVARNDAFAEHGMGLGEYTYIYVLAYYNWLGKSPQDGPVAEDEDHGDFDRAFARARRNLITNLENQLASLPEVAQAAVPGGLAAEAEPGDPRQALEAEIEAMRADRHRIPWEDGLPPAIEESLRPFRDALESSYDPVTNPFEIARMEQRGNFSFEID